jgi:hypothetical protein
MLEYIYKQLRPPTIGSRKTPSYEKEQCRIQEMQHILERREK